MNPRRTLTEFMRWIADRFPVRSAGTGGTPPTPPVQPIQDFAEIAAEVHRNKEMAARAAMQFDLEC